MKRIILIAVTFAICFICKAQYNYFNPYLYSAIAAETAVETYDTYKLNSIRFDENLLRQNSEVWGTYKKYLQIDADYAKKSKVYSAISWVGLGVTCVSLIPMCLDFDGPKGDAALDWGIGLLCVGGVTSIVGLLGWAVQLDKIKTNKKEFIYYLKTTNNGVGIVTIF